MLILLASCVPLEISRKTITEESYELLSVKDLRDRITRLPPNELVYRRDIHDVSVFEEILYRGDVELVRLLLDRGVNPNCELSNGTPLCLACRRDLLSTAHVLLCRGARVNVTDKSGNTPLHLCFMRTGTEMVAARRFSAALADLLLTNGAVLDSFNNLHETPLHLAVENEDAEGVRTLIEHGANTSLLNGDGLTALDLARDNKAIRILLDRRRSD